MASTHRAPKQWCLSKSETINSFENWRQNLLYTLSLDSNFAPFLAEGFMWGKKTKADLLRGFTDDGEDVTEANRLTAQQKVNFLELMLGQIANYCPIIARNTLVKNSTSIHSICMEHHQAAFWIPDYRSPFHRLRWHSFGIQWKTWRSVPAVDGVCRGHLAQS